METKMKSQYLEELKWKIGYSNGVFIDRIGLGGGLALFWKNETQVELFGFSLNHIDVAVSEEGIDFKWRLTGFYGFPETDRRENS